MVSVRVRMVHRLNQSSIKESENAYVLPGKNIFNKDSKKIIFGKYLNASDILQTNADYYVSDYIRILPDTQYFATQFNVGGAFCLFYDVDGNFITGSGITGSIGLITSPSTAYYIRMSGYVWSITAAQLEIGTSYTGYESFTSNYEFTQQVWLQKIVKQLSIIIPAGNNILPIGITNDLYGFAVLNSKYFIKIDSRTSPNQQAVIPLFVQVIGGSVIYTNSAYYLTYLELDSSFNPLSLNSLFNNSASAVLNANTKYVLFQYYVSYAENIIISVGSLKGYEPFVSETKSVFRLNYPTKFGFLNIGGGYNNTGSNFRLFRHSCPLPIFENTDIFCTGDSDNQYTEFVRFLDINKKYISAVSNVTAQRYGRYKITAPVNAKWIEVGTRADGLNSSYIEYETNIRSVQDIFKNILSYVSEKEDNEILFPERICIAKGDEFNLYYRNLIESEKDHSLFIPSYGSNYSRQWTFKPTSVLNESQITLRNNISGDSVLRKIKITESTGLTGILNILTVGDSFADIGFFYDRAYTKLESSGYTVNAIGRKNVDKAHINNHGSENKSGGIISDFATDKPGVKFTVLGVTTAPSGYWPRYSDVNGNIWEVYFAPISGGVGYMEAGLISGSLSNLVASGTLTKVSGTGDTTISFSVCEAWNLNPFWNDATEKLDFQNYISLYGYNSPDVLVLQFMLNDVGDSTSISSIDNTINKIKEFITQFHIDYPDAVVIYSIPPVGAIKYTGLSNKELEYKNRKVFIQKIISEFDYNTLFPYVFVSPGYACVDREYGYALSDVTPSEIVSQVEKHAADPAHCTWQGMYQIGDCLYSYILNAIN